MHDTVVPILYTDLLDMQQQMKEMQNEIELLNIEINICNSKCRKLQYRTTLQRMQKQEEHVAKVYSFNKLIDEIED